MSAASETPDPPVFAPLGVDALVLRFSDRLDPGANAAAIAARARIDAARPEGVTETASSLTSVLVRFDPGRTTREALAKTLRESLADAPSAADAEPRRIWRIPAVIGGEHGPDLDEAAGLAGRSVSEATDDILSARLRVLAIGFSPGQPYTGFLPEAWDIPRQSGITPTVPVGALVVAVRQLIPFGVAAPTGWRRIGWTPFRPYLPGRETPLPLAAGDGIEFRAVTEDEALRLKDAEDGMSGAERGDAA